MSKVTKPSNLIFTKLTRTVVIYITATCDVNSQPLTNVANTEHYSRLKLK